MNDIFKDMQAKVGCEYLSDLPSYKRKVWQEMKLNNPGGNPSPVRRMEITNPFYWKSRFR